MDFTSIPDFPGYFANREGVIRGKRVDCLKPSYNNKGYAFVNLSLEGVAKSYLVHRLIAQTFLLNPDNYTEIDHIDKDKTNNCVENLRWVSRCQNLQNRDFDKTSKYGMHGLGFDKTRECWNVQIYLQGKKYHRRFKERSDAEEYLVQLKKILSQ
jgi:hypothetical protein